MFPQGAIVVPSEGTTRDTSSRLLSISDALKSFATVPRHFQVNPYSVMSHLEAKKGNPELARCSETQC